MSPHEWTPYQKDFAFAAAMFGWERRQGKAEHERDESRSWTFHYYIVPGSDRRLFDEADLEEPMVKELIRISNLLQMPTSETARRDLRDIYTRNVLSFDDR